MSKHHGLLLRIYPPGSYEQHQRAARPIILENDSLQRYSFQSLAIPYPTVILYPDLVTGLVLSII